MNKDKIYIEMVYKLNAVPTNIMAEKIITMQPIILLRFQMYRTFL